jgi:hypothetical protein
MKTLILTLATLALGISVAHIARADEDIQVSAFRGLDGQYGPQSLWSIRVMRQAAKDFGEISVWVTFDMNFVGNPLLRTAEVIESEARAKEWHIAQVVQPVVGRGEARLLSTPVGLEQAPGCRVSVTSKGLTRLVRHRNVKHISLVQIPQQE